MSVVGAHTTYTFSTTGGKMRDLGRDDMATLTEKAVNEQLRYAVQYKTEMYGERANERALIETRALVKSETEYEYATCSHISKLLRLPLRLKIAHWTRGIATTPASPRVYRTEAMLSPSSRELL